MQPDRGCARYSSSASATASDEVQAGGSLAGNDSSTASSTSDSDGAGSDGTTGGVRGSGMPYSGTRAAGPASSAAVGLVAAQTGATCQGRPSPPRTGSATRPSGTRRHPCQIRARPSSRSMSCAETPPSSDTARVTAQPAHHVGHLREVQAEWHRGAESAQTMEPVIATTRRPSASEPMASRASRCSTSTPSPASRIWRGHVAPGVDQRGVGLERLDDPSRIPRGGNLVGSQPPEAPARPTRLPSTVAPGRGAGPPGPPSPPSPTA